MTTAKQSKERKLEREIRKEGEEARKSLNESILGAETVVLEPQHP